LSFCTDGFGRYGGIFERGSHEYTLDDFYSIQLDKMDRFVCLKKSDIVIPEDEESSSDGGDDVEDSDEGTEEDGGDDESELDEDMVGEDSHIVLSPSNESDEKNGHEQDVGTPDELRLTKATISEVCRLKILFDRSIEIFG